jgi:hygromycin-B 4-O-kinase
MSVDVARAERFLRERFGADVREVTTFEQGEWSKAFAFRHDGRGYVVRFSAHEEDFAKDRIAMRYSGPSLPVPTVVEIGEALGGHYLISERLYGSYIDHADGPQMRALLPALFAVLDAMRDADISWSTGYGIWGADGQAPFPSWPAFLLDVGMDRPEDRIAGWRAALDASPAGPEPFDRAYRRLQELAPSLPESRHLIHSDLLHFNVLVQDARITAVLDWGCGLYGDFLYDVAWHSFWAPWYTAWDGIDFAAEAARHVAEIGLEVPRFEERLLACELHIGLGGQAYQAYKGYWSEMEWTARRTLDVLRRA